MASRCAGSTAAASAALLVREVAGSDPKPEACRRELNVTPSEPGKDVAIGEYAKLLPTMTAFLKRSGKHALGVAAIGNPEKSLGRGARVRGRNLSWREAQGRKVPR